MKKNLFTFCLLFAVSVIHAQNGLENIIVEKYYISDANDSVATDAISLSPGVLPVGSVTYRIYVDLMQGYTFQAGFGVPAHELRFETTTMFYNNEDRGATQPNYSKNIARNNTVMIDSWLSCGAGCIRNFGILKSEDDGIATVVNNNAPPALQNNDTAVGIPLSLQDGLILTADTPVDVSCIPSCPPIFDNTQFGNLFSSRNFSWAALKARGSGNPGGAIGPDTTNKILIAQMTTDGIFSFKLNLQIGTPGGGTQQFVADSAVGTEIQLNALSQTFYPAGPTKVQDVSQASHVTLAAYPNPASELLSVVIHSAKRSNENTLFIYDVLGKELFHKNMGALTGTREEKIDISFLADGCYILQLTSDGAKSSRQVMKH